MTRRVQRQEVDITEDEKREIDNLPHNVAVNQLDSVYVRLREIKEEKKADPHLREVRQQVQDINKDYKERTDLAQAKAKYLVAHLKRLANQ